ncbi:MAG: 30S ribosomal protein S1 [Deltaproteobacteria bacterium HGW-Deltaproteobacteria-14]|nr:MAG: 30S ribosomal protein S1 [Deltaproteobacteria bacterium HGW-Deltaproteobacteria-14]
MSSEENTAPPAPGLGPVTAGPDGVETLAPESASVVSKGVGEQAATGTVVPPKPEPKLDTGVEVAEDVDFAALMGDKPQQASEEPTFEPGDKVKGVVEVVSLHGQEVFLDLGGKATGYVLKEELRGEDGEITVKQGDELEGIVVGVNSNGVHIKVRLGADVDSRALREAFTAGIPVEGKVIATNKGGYDVLIAGQRAFCPFSQIDVYRLEDPESVVGQVFAFKITEMRSGSVVISRAALMRAEQAERAAETAKKLQVGAKLTGRVRNIQKFGVFVDLGGIDGLVHVSELSWDRVGDPHEAVKMGQEVEVVVLEIDPEKERIALSMRQTQGDPFETAVGGIQVGEIVTGAVVRLTNFGAFVSLAPGVDGLIHVSDLAHARVRHPKEVLNVGDTVKVRVMEMDLERRRIALSLKALAEDPWDAAASKYQPGQAVTGTIESVQVFGVFVTLEPGITALLPASESNTPGTPLQVAFKPGDTVEAKILRVDSHDRKIAITRREDSGRASDDGRPSGRRGGPGGGPGGPGRGGPRGERRDRGGFDRFDRNERGGGGERRGGTLAYSDRPEKATDDRGKEVGSLGEMLLRALKKDD